jgi:pimeloyl-ACP methyl ester carboxylesterase
LNLQNPKRTRNSQLTWHTIGPILAQNYTVLVVDLRGCGSSSIPRNGDYTSEAVSTDLLNLLSFLNITQTYVFSHDKGVGPATALTFKNHSLVKRLSMAEYVLPGTGLYEASSNPSPSWDLYSSWQLAFFSVPDAAQFFIQGREKEMLAWYFYHASYTGNSAIKQEHLERYTTEISKPGFLRSGLEYFATTEVDGKFFNASIQGGKLTQPVLALGGETSLSPVEIVQAGMGVLGVNSTSEFIPQSGHWIGISSSIMLLRDADFDQIGDENPVYVADRLLKFFGDDEGIPSVDLSYWRTRLLFLSKWHLGPQLGRRHHSSGVEDTFEPAANISSFYGAGSPLIIILLMPLI